MEIVKDDKNTYVRDNMSSNYLPSSQEVGLTKVDKTEEVVEEVSFMDTAKQAALMSFVEGILPKIKPFINPAVKKLEEYFGDDEKVFLITRKKDRAARVIVLDNTKGSYIISNEVFDHTNPQYVPLDGETNEAQTKRLIDEAIAKAKDDLTKKIENIKNRKNIGVQKTFEADEIAVINVHATDIFIEKLLSGEYTTNK